MKRSTPTEAGTAIVLGLIVLVIAAAYLIHLRVPARFGRALAFLSAIEGEHPPFWVRPLIFPIQEETVRVTDWLTAKIYRPAEERKTAGVVLIPGLHPKGIFDARFIGLAEALAHQGFTVLAPDIKDFRHFQLAEQGVQAIIHSVEYMAEKMSGVDPSKVGLFGISYAAGLALIAASRQEVIKKIAFIVSLGGYYDLRNPIQFVLSGSYEIDGKRVKLQPHPWVRMIFALNNLEFIVSGEDLPKLRRALTCHLELDEKCATEWEERLSPYGKVIRAAIMEPPNESTQRIMLKAVKRISDLSNELSPAFVLDRALLNQMRARIYLIHGTQDSVIPASETILLAQMLEKRGHPAQCVLITKAVTHVDPNQKALNGREKLFERFKLIRFLMELFKER